MRITTLRARFATAGIATAIVVGSFGAGPAAAFKDKNCDDFKSQKQAQKWFKKHGGDKKHNAGELDADGDGIACETTEY